MSTSDSPWLFEVIAGMIEPNEDPDEVCHRESFEEAGITLTGLRKALTYLSSPGGTTERLHIYTAKTDATLARGVHGLASESEDIMVHRVKESEAREWLDNGKIDNAAAIIALQWFFLNKKKLLASWN
jgi:ADP-ribose pyrophosphatase